MEATDAIDTTTTVDFACSKDIFQYRGLTCSYFPNSQIYWCPKLESTQLPRELQMEITVSFAILKILIIVKVTRKCHSQKWLAKCIKRQIFVTTPSPNTEILLQ